MVVVVSGPLSWVSGLDCCLTALYRRAGKYRITRSDLSVPRCFNRTGRLAICQSRATRSCLRSRRELSKISSALRLPEAKFSQKMPVELIFYFSNRAVVNTHSVRRHGIHQRGKPQRHRPVPLGCVVRAIKAQERALDFMIRPVDYSERRRLHFDNMDKIAWVWQGKWISPG